MILGKYLEILNRRDRDQSDISDKRPPSVETGGGFGRFGRFGRNVEGFCQVAFDALESRCPEYVDHDRWQQAIADGRRFLVLWGDQAVGLGWTVRDVFGLADVPNRPMSNYQRLSRYDQTGLIWLLQGRRVVALTEHTAIIETTAGTLSYRRHNKPALEPAGDSLDDFLAGPRSRPTNDIGET